MEEKMRVMSERPLNAETHTPCLRSWITANAVFFDRNQGSIPDPPARLSDGRPSIEGAVETPVSLNFENILRMPRAICANTLECSGNSRSLLEKKAAGNPWTIGGVGNAMAVQFIGFPFFKAIVTAKPLGMQLRAETVPLQVSTQVLTIASPRPTLPESLSREGSGRKKGSKS